MFKQELTQCYELNGYFIEFTVEVCTVLVLNTATTPPAMFSIAAATHHIHLALHRTALNFMDSCNIGESGENWDRGELGRLT